MDAPEYPKIKTLWVRGEDHKVIPWGWSQPEFEYLRDCQWELTEKVDGMNIRVALESYSEPTDHPLLDWFLGIYGRTAAADIPPFLVDKLTGLFTVDKLRALWRGQKGCERCGGTGWYDPQASGSSLVPYRCECVVPYPITLYGEGFGERIQKVGHKYIPDGVGFVLFDVRVGDVWLKRGDVYEIASRLGIPHVPVVRAATLPEAAVLVRNGIRSAWGDFEAEGVVARPTVELQTRFGRRVIGKLKTKDF
jgi:hypothetical protein